MTGFQSMLAQLETITDKGIRFGGAEAPLVSYAQLLEAGRRQAGALPDTGEIVLVQADNRRHTVETLLACWWAGLVPACVPPPGRLADGQGYAESLDAWKRLTGARQVFSEPLGEGSPLLEARQLADTAYIQFSSGTTWRPKAVRLSHGNLEHNIRALLGRILGDSTEHSCVSWLPLYHDMGLVGCLLCAMAARGDLVLLRPYQFAARPSSWLLALSQSRATVSAAPNFAFTQCLERISPQQRDELDLSNWKFALLGSETVQAATLHEFYRTFRECGLKWESLTPVYGLAEATLAVTFSGGPRLITIDGRELVSVGRPLDGVELRVLEDGRIQTRSPSVMLGYLGDAESPVDEDGWLDTGDLGFVDEGELVVTGRCKETLIVRGRNYQPEEFEAALATVDGLDPGRAAAFSLPHNGSERVVILAERRRRDAKLDEPLEDAVRSAVARRLNTPVEVRLVEAGWLPRTTSGKIRRNQARQRYLEEFAD